MKKDQSQTSCRAEPTARPGYSKVAVQRRFAVQRRLNERPGHPLVDCLHTLIDALKGLHGALLEADIVWSEDMSTQVPPPGTVLLLTSCMAAPSSNPQALPSQWNVTACYLHRDDPHSGSCGIMMVAALMQAMTCRSPSSHSGARPCGVCCTAPTGASLLRKTASQLPSGRMPLSSPGCGCRRLWAE